MIVMVDIMMTMIICDLNVCLPCFHPEVLFTMLIFKMVRDGKLPPRIITLNGSESKDIIRGSLHRALIGIQKKTGSYWGC